MAADSLICDSLYETYTLVELEGAKRSIASALLSPGSLTGEQLEGVSFQFQPKTEAELRRGLENIKCAIDKHNEEEPVPDASRSRFPDFSPRPME